MPDIVSLGECMVELYADEPLAVATTFHKAYGGDTLNLLVAASRLGSSTGYITLVGDDPFAPFLLDAWDMERVDTSQVRRVPGFNGFYLISLLSGGQRDFHYYRRGSAAITITPAHLDPAYLSQARFFHTSGITQAIGPSARETAMEALRQAYASGVTVSFDPNYRSALWSREEALQALEEVLPFCNILLPSAPVDTQELLGIADPEECIRTLWSRGVPTVVVKLGEEGCVVGHQGQIERVPPFQPEAMVDTTGAGDAFGGGFLHGLNQSMSPIEAARLGTIVAGLKVQAEVPWPAFLHERRLKGIGRALSLQPNSGSAGLGPPGSWTRLLTTTRINESAFRQDRILFLSGKWRITPLSWCQPSSAGATWLERDDGTTAHR